MPDGAVLRVAATVPTPTMRREITLDARNMEPPEPLERVLEAIGSFAKGDRLRLLIDFEPVPLYRILERNGFGHHAEPGTVSNYEVTIWMME